MRLLRWSVLILTALLGMFGLIQAGLSAGAGEFQRPASLAWNPNVLAVMMIGGALCAVRFRRPLLLTVCILTLVITFSRAGYIAGLAALATYKAAGASPCTPGKVEAGRGRFWSHRFLWGGLVLVGLGVIAWRTAQPDSLLWYRLELWRLALRIIVENPTGIGFDGVSSYLSAHDSVTPQAYHAHNLLLQIGAAWGIAGLSLLAAIVTSGGMIARRSPSALAFFAALLADGLFDYIWWVWPMAILVAAQFILLASPEPRIVSAAQTASFRVACNFYSRPAQPETQREHRGIT